MAKSKKATGTSWLTNMERFVRHNSGHHTSRVTDFYRAEAENRWKNDHFSEVNKMVGGRR